LLGTWPCRAALPFAQTCNIRKVTPMRKIHVVGAGCAALACTMLSFDACAQSSVGTVTVCYYSAECNYANISAIIHTPSAGQAARDSGEHLGRPGYAPTGTATPVDAPAFQFTNTSASVIKDATFGIVANKKLGVPHDVFHIGKIAAGASVTIVPGASNDKKVHPTGGFFTFSSPGNPLDTSDSGPDDNTIVFEFNGKIGAQKVTSGRIVVGHFVIEATDGTVAKINFLGGPGNADAPCNDCYAPKVIASITD
jgi:hypothetical protein